MDTLGKILDIASRLDHLSNCADWVARETVHTDNGLSQTGTLMAVLIEDIREKMNQLVNDLEHLNLEADETDDEMIQ